LSSKWPFFNVFPQKLSIQCLSLPSMLHAQPTVVSQITVLTVCTRWPVWNTEQKNKPITQMLFSSILELWGMFLLFML
jgi:hypothetical protein